MANCPPPAIGRVAHYVSYGTPGGEYQSECRAAIIAELDCCPEENEEDEVFAVLAVFTPQGMFFPGLLPQDEEGHSPGSWHWPERTPE